MGNKAFQMQKEYVKSAKPEYYKFITNYYAQFIMLIKVPAIYRSWATFNNNAECRDKRKVLIA
jgi:hypothetical protein